MGPEDADMFEEAGYLYLEICEFKLKGGENHRIFGGLPVKQHEICDGGVRPQLISRLNSNAALCGCWTGRRHALSSAAGFATLP